MAAPAPLTTILTHIGKTVSRSDRGSTKESQLYDPFSQTYVNPYSRQGRAMKKFSNYLINYSVYLHRCSTSYYNDVVYTINSIYQEEKGGVLPVLDINLTMIAYLNPEDTPDGYSVHDDPIFKKTVAQLEERKVIQHQPNLLERCKISHLLCFLVTTKNMHFTQ